MGVCWKVPGFNQSRATSWHSDMDGNGISMPSGKQKRSQSPCCAQLSASPHCVKGNLFEIQIFHTDRGSEFDNILIDEFLESFQIRRSLSMKGCPYDNAVAESTFKMINAEFVAGSRFDTLEQLRLELADYVHWFNHIRLHSTLGYRTPVEFRNACTL